MARNNVQSIVEKDSIVLQANDAIWGRVTNDPLLYEKNDLGIGNLVFRRTKVENLVDGKWVLISQEEQDEALLKYNPKKDGDIVRVFFENGAIGTLVRDQTSTDIIKESETRLVDVTNEISIMTSGKIRLLEAEIEDLKAENAELKLQIASSECKKCDVSEELKSQDEAEQDAPK